MNELELNYCTTLYMSTGPVLVVHKPLSPKKKQKVLSKKMQRLGRTG